MIVELVSTADKRIVKMAAKAFGHALHLAHLQGWKPEQARDEWPQAEWETVIILPHLGAYLPGIVSDADAERLHQALQKAIRSSDPHADQELYAALHTLLGVTDQGEFDVHFYAGDSVEREPGP
jgi:hypothetical protein